MHNPEWNQKATNQQIEELYKEHKSVYKVAKYLKMCPQSIHERLVKMEKIIPLNVWKDSEIKLVLELYQNGFERGDGQLDKLSNVLKRTKPTISRKAKELGLTNSKRKVEKQFCIEKGIKQRDWLSKNLHPRGMLGKTHSDEYCQLRRDLMLAIPKAEHERRAKLRMKSNLEKYGQVFVPRENPKTSWKQSWREFGGRRIYFRSSWEANYGRYLQWLKENGHILDWEHEPQTFWFEGIKRGSVTYLPDFKVTFLDKRHHEWHEVKGWMDARSKTKLKRFRKYYPAEKLKVIDKKWFIKNNHKMKLIIKDWE